MYRRYEDPYKLQEQLKEKRSEYEARKELGADIDELIELSIEINDLEQRINFAWQDDEFDCDYCD